MGRKQQSYWTVRYKYLSLSSHMWCSMELLDHPVVIKDNMVFSPALDTCIGRTWGVMGSWTILPFHNFITRCWQTRTQCDQLDRLFTNLTNFRPTFHQLDQPPTKFTNFTNFSPTFHQLHQLHQIHQLHQLFTNFTNFSPTSPTFHQLFTNFSSTLHQLFTHLSPTSPGPGQSHQLQQLFANFTDFSPTFHQLD